jgi:hypothetical protein
MLYILLFLLSILTMGEMLSDCYKIPDFEISSLNCNSLNCSQITSLHHKLKMYGIVKLKSDLILLSDILLNSSASGFGSVIKKNWKNFFGQPLL